MRATVRLLISSEHWTYTSWEQEVSVSLKGGEESQSEESEDFDHEDNYFIYR